MKKPTLIQFVIEKQDKYYIARALFFPIFTQAKSLDDLIINIKEAVECHFEDKKSLPVMINFALNSYA